jgi:hypothetical protein
MKAAGETQHNKRPFRPCTIKPSNPRITEPQDGCLTLTLTPSAASCSDRCTEIPGEADSVVFGQGGVTHGLIGPPGARPKNRPPTTMGVGDGGMGRGRGIAAPLYCKQRGPWRRRTADNAGQVVRRSPLLVAPRARGVHRGASGGGHDPQIRSKGCHFTDWIIMEHVSLHCIKEDEYRRLARECLRPKKPGLRW